MKSGQVRSGQVSSSQVRSGQVRSDQVRSDQISSGQVRSDRVTRFLWFLERAARRKFCFCNPSARSAEKNFAMLDGVTCFHCYLARAARRKFCFCNPSARSAEKNFATLDQVTRFLWYLEMLGQHWVSADGKNTKVERFICRKHNGRAKTSLQKAFFGIFFAKTRLPSLHFFFT